MREAAGTHGSSGDRIGARGPAALLGARDGHDGDGAPDRHTGARRALSADADNDALTAPRSNSITASQVVGTTLEYPISAMITNTLPSANDVFVVSNDLVRVSIMRMGDRVAS